MSIATLKSSSAAEEGKDSLDTIIRQAIGNESSLSFSRAGDNPVQWIQLLHALDQQGLPGWPLLSPVKVQMQKCEKCSQEFCSTINYRRHTRLHRRSLNFDKDSAYRSREFLEVFWDKLPVDEAMETVSFKDIMLEDVSGPSVTKALTAFICKPGLSSFPLVYLKAGAVLLDIVQGRPSKFPLSSQELFNVLDEASEKTFLRTGTAESLQKYVFDGEAGKIGLEMRNLIACTSFLIEQKLVKAWLADKDAEALRCQKLLVEEEEAAQKRQAALLEKKRLKKLRQKEQKAKDQANVEAFDSREHIASGVECHPSPSPSSPGYTSDSNSQNTDGTQDMLPSSHELDQNLDVGKVGSTEPQSGSDSGYPESDNFRDVDTRMLHRSGRRHLVSSRWELPQEERSSSCFYPVQDGHVMRLDPKQKYVGYRDTGSATATSVSKVWTSRPKFETEGTRNSCRLQRSSGGFYPVQNNHVMRLGPKQNHAAYRDTRSATATSVSKVWTPKPKSETEEETNSWRLQNEKSNSHDQFGNCELLIGSISVTLGNCDSQHQAVNGQAQENSISETGFHLSKHNLTEKPGNRPAVKLSRRVSQHDPIIGNRNDDSEVRDIACRASDQILQACDGDSNIGFLVDETCSLKEGRKHASCIKFSSQDAEDFLAQRWKEAMASDHVKLILAQEAEAPKCPEIQDNCREQEVTQSSKPNILNTAENCSVSSRATGTSVTIRLKFRSDNRKVYIPKERC